MDNTTLRLAAPEDGAALLDIYAPYIRETAITFEYEVPTAEEFAQRIRGVEEKYPWLVAERDGVPVGYAYLSSFHPRAAVAWCAETSIYLRQDCQRQGLGRRLYAALEDCAYKQGLRNLNAAIAVPEREDEYLTMDSIHFHQRMGYQMVGEFHRCGYKFGRWYGLCWMEKLIAPHPAVVPPVRPFDSSRWTEGEGAQTFL